MKKVRSKSSLIKAQFTPPPEDARGDDYELRDGDPLILCNGRTGEILEQYNYDSCVVRFATISAENGHKRRLKEAKLVPF